jgi:hypothetical protein
LLTRYLALTFHGLQHQVAIARLRLKLHIRKQIIEEFADQKTFFVKDRPPLSIRESISISPIRSLTLLMVCPA